jgi:hypothetical protein
MPKPATNPQHRKDAQQIQPPRCPYCAQLSVFIASSEEAYYGRDYGPLYICRPCKAWVGCHPGTKVPLGSLANVTLRHLRISVKSLFDPLWVNAETMYESGPPAALRRAARDRAYSWLAEQLGIPMEECYVGLFTEPMCERAIQVLHTQQPTMWSIRQWATSRKTDGGRPL